MVFFFHLQHAVQKLYRPIQRTQRSSSGGIDRKQMLDILYEALGIEHQGLGTSEL